MKRRIRGLGAVVAAGATVLASVAIVPAAVAAPADDSQPTAAQRLDNRPGPLTDRQNERRKAAQRLILSGQAAPNEDGVVTLAQDKYFEATLEGTAQVFTILAQFGTQGDKKLGTVPGPLHNEIPQPDRSVNNSTHWLPDFNTGSYEDLFFGDGESFKDFYLKQSSGAYSVAGEVSDWVTVPGNASTYGDNAVEDFGGAWKFIQDSGNAWYAAQKTAGKTDAQINAELASFDVWDRYDADGDGDFDEPDGYLDHFQAVHAGEGEDAGGGAQGEDAIWSHRWYVNSTDYGLTGPSETAKFGGAKIGNSNYWIGDYTVEAENGGLGVFAHEFGHDLGLPDFYDTNGGENSTAFWTLMSSGSWLNHGGEDIGTTPGYMGPWEKLQLGWLDYDVVDPGESGSFTLSPAALQVSDQSQALVVDVPDEAVTTDYATPAGGHAWWTSSADDLNTTLTRTLNLTGIAKASVSASAWYDIEDGFDYLYAEYKPAGAANWTTLATISGTTKDKWTGLKLTVPGGGNVDFRFRYQSDGGVHLGGAFIDDIVVKANGKTLLSDNVETGANGWTAAGGFKISTGSEEAVGDRYYLLENRTYVGYDSTLEVGPYQFSNGITKPDWVERFPFQDGLLVWAVDETYSDNNTIDHPGHGLALPVDARPVKFTYSDGTGPSNRRQPFDATFGLQATDAIALHKEVVVGKGSKATVQTLEAAAPSNAGIATFDDSVIDRYFSTTNPLGGVYVAGAGVTATVTEQNTGGTLRVDVVNPE
ncbi:immune inhibitor A domain-containing protein [Microbacterium sp. SS28]|uniref:immune inhibitor A domain-containing protein n=1 Tax=Microbacterium sp. SS28 TaxID=2919948 RepID=UPI001FAACEF3|nr:immune inhibitor A domain-containing protein [Microbacterium sp. SS28]